MSKTFRDKKNLFLTYPRCNLTREQLFSFLKEQLGLNLLSYYIVRETHKKIEEDEIELRPYHLHCYLKLDTPLKVRRENYFDTRGYHPNV